MALEQSFSLDLIFVSRDYMTCKVPPRPPPRYSKVLSLKRVDTGGSSLSSSQVFGNPQWGSAEPRDLEALKLTLFPLLPPVAHK